MKVDKTAMVLTVSACRTSLCLLLPIQDGTGLKPGFGGDYRLCTASGSFLPFAKTKAERLASGDPRLSLEERYPNHDSYVKKVEQAAKKLVT